MIGRLSICILMLAGLAACASEPQYPVRPGEPRAQMPKPSYPITQSEPDDRPTPPPRAYAPPPRPVTAAPAQEAPEDDTYIHPRPDTDAPPPPDMRGHQSPGPSMAVRSAPIPALETPREVTVRPGESLFEVAERVRTPVRALIDANGLRPPYEVTPGDTLKVPAPVIYTVKAGDTLMSIGRRYSVDPRSLANFNDIALETPLQPGQRIAMPTSVRDGEAKPATTASTAPAKPYSPLAAARTPTKPLASTAPAAAAAATASTASAAQAAEPEAPSSSSVIAAGKGRFAWPIKGDILSTYGPKGPGQRNDGVNIAATSGEVVKAAASGEVVYAGNSVPGFGNLVVVKHPGGWTSLYGNLGKMSVKIRAPVEQGQELGLAGTSGAVDRPQVHFEVRYAATPDQKARPVDPQSLLP